MWGTSGDLSTIHFIPAIKVGGDTIVSSPFHRFWVTGSGWVMARDRKGGEILRLL